MARSPVVVGLSPTVDGHQDPLSSSTDTTFCETYNIIDGVMVPKRRKHGRRAHLDGHLARRKHPPRETDYIIWDTELAGFGLRIRPSGNHSWLVRFRERGKLKKISLGRCADVQALEARAEARKVLARAALDGLPKRPRTRYVPLFRDYAVEFETDYFGHWKPQTQKISRRHILFELVPAFGDLPVNEIRPTDVMNWRDGFTDRQGVFNRAIPVLASMLNYAEQLGYCSAGKNPCRGTPRFKRQLLERYLTPAEYHSLARELDAAETENPVEIAAIRMLLLTGARCSEITNLKWDWVEPPRLRLPDSKTGPKTIFLNSQAEAILAGQTRHYGCDLVFPNRRRRAPVRLDTFWIKFRRRARIPDVRIHDLRHSFASTMLMEAMPLATIGRLLGHALHESTERYAHLADDIISDAAQRVAGSLADALGLVE